MYPDQRLLCVLNGIGDPIPEPDRERWLDWMARDQFRIVLETQTACGVRITTIFLGFNWGCAEAPIYFETLIQGGPLDGCLAYSSSHALALCTHDILEDHARG